MSTAFGPRRLLHVALLILAWCGLWQEISLPNVIMGALIGFLVTWDGVGPPAVGGVNPVALMQFTGLVLIDLVRSTVSVAKEIITPSDNTEEAIVAVKVPGAGRRHFLILTVAITLTPGTAVVDADPDKGILYLHLLYQNGQRETIEHTKRLARLAEAALPSGDDLPDNQGAVS